MDSLFDMLPLWERLPLRLRVLYEKYGYMKYRMGKFEPYEMYMENKEFLKSEGIITFTDASGRLMALKPDVTMSIVKNARDDGGTYKYYYNENVFRIERKGEEYREINQIGIEYIGADTCYAASEVVGLALDTLAVISDEHMLDISHMGFISGLLFALGIEGGGREEVLCLLRQKNTDGIRTLSRELGLSVKNCDALIGASRLRLPLGQGLEAAQELVLSDEMEFALWEMRRLYGTLEAAGKSEGITLDFSVLNDLDYYNGILFRGYIRQAPRAVLAGGRYDNLLRRFGKSQGAVGFALYLSGLDRAFYEPLDYDVDLLLTYGGAPADKVAGVVSFFVARGYSVRAEKESLPGLRAKKTLTLDEALEWKGGMPHA